ncbi:MAG: hypothetical protein JNK15_25810 [Planctomycetes bacterium]|nr:hypothetical protein [Planctomycetota bacterium]
MTATDQQRYEHYLFLRLYGIDFDRARDALTQVDRTDVLHLREAMLRDAIVSYCRPFSGNQGAKGRHRLRADDCVLKSERPLHDELIGLRDQLFAHSDLTYHDPKAMSVGANIMMTFKEADYDSLLPRTAQLRQLIDSVAQHVEREVRQQHTAPWFPGMLERTTLPLGSMNLAGKGPGSFRMTSRVQIMPTSEPPSGAAGGAGSK